MNDWYLKILVVGAVNVMNFGTTRLLGCQGFGMGTCTVTISSRRKFVFVRKIARRLSFSDVDVIGEVRELYTVFELVSN